MRNSYLESNYANSIYFSFFQLTKNQISIWNTRQIYARHLHTPSSPQIWFVFRQWWLSLDKLICSLRLSLQKNLLCSKSLCANNKHIFHRKTRIHGYFYWNFENPTGKKKIVFLDTVTILRYYLYKEKISVIVIIQLIW